MQQKIQYDITNYRFDEYISILINIFIKLLKKKIN